MARKSLNFRQSSAVSGHMLRVTWLECVFLSRNVGNLSVTYIKAPFFSRTSSTLSIVGV
jgi:hypothetical protein